MAHFPIVVFLFLVISHPSVVISHVYMSLCLAICCVSYRYLENYGHFVSCCCLFWCLFCIYWFLIEYLQSGYFVFGFVWGFFLKLFISFCHLFIRIYCHSPVIFILLVWLSVLVLLFSQCTSPCSHFISFFSSFEAFVTVLYFSKFVPSKHFFICYDLESYFWKVCVFVVVSLFLPWLTEIILHLSKDHWYYFISAVFLCIFGAIVSVCHHCACFSVCLMSLQINFHLYIFVF